MDKPTEKELKILALSDEEFEKKLAKWEADYLDDCLWQDWLDNIYVTIF